MRPRADRLAIYLNDHLAAATGAVELSRRAANSNHNNDFGAVLDELARAIRDDRELLVDVMTRLAIKPDRIKGSSAWLAEKLGRLKLNGELTRYSPLSRLEELELLELGVAGKLGCWDALQRALADDPRLRGVDLPAAIKRARAQRTSLQRLRRRSAGEALAPERSRAQR